MILKLTDSSKLLISYSLTQYCRVLGHAITTKPPWQESSFRRVPWLFLAWVIPLPLTQGGKLSLAPQVLQLPDSPAALQRSWGGRRAAQETGKGFYPLLHTPAQHPVHSESALLLGHSGTRGISHSRKGSWPALVPPPGHFACMWARHVTLQKDAADKWFKRKKAKTYKTSSWNTHNKMMNHANAAWGEYGRRFAGLSFQTLDRQSEPLTSVPKSSCLSKGYLAQGEAQQSLTQAEVRKKPQKVCHLKMQRKGNAMFSLCYPSQNKHWHGRLFSAKLIPVTTAIHKTNQINENSRYDFRGQLHEEGSGWQLIPLLLQQCCLKWFVLSFKSGLTEKQDNGRKLLP